MSLASDVSKLLIHTQACSVPVLVSGDSDLVVDVHGTLHHSVRWFNDEFIRTLRGSDISLRGDTAPREPSSDMNET